MIYLLLVVYALACAVVPIVRLLRKDHPPADSDTWAPLPQASTSVQIFVTAHALVLGACAILSGIEGRIFEMVAAVTLLAVDIALFLCFLMISHVSWSRHLPRITGCIAALMYVAWPTALLIHEPSVDRLLAVLIGHVCGSLLTEAIRCPPSFSLFLSLVSLVVPFVMLVTERVQFESSFVEVMAVLLYPLVLLPGGFAGLVPYLYAELSSVVSQIFELQLTLTYVLHCMELAKDVTADSSFGELCGIMLAFRFAGCASQPLHHDNDLVLRVAATNVPFTLLELLVNVVEIARRKARPYGVTFELHTSCTDTDAFVGNAPCLKQALIILVDIVIRSKPRAPVVLFAETSLSTCPNGPPSAVLRLGLKVNSRGSSLDPEDLRAHLNQFSSHVTVGDERMSVWICSRLVSVMKGDLEMVSEEDNQQFDTHFTVNINLEYWMDSSLSDKCSSFSSPASGAQNRCFPHSLSTRAALADFPNVRSVSFLHILPHQISSPRTSSAQSCKRTTASFERNVRGVRRSSSLHSMALDSKNSQIVEFAQPDSDKASLFGGRDSEPASTSHWEAQELGSRNLLRSYLPKLWSGSRSTNNVKKLTTRPSSEGFLAHVRQASGIHQSWSMPAGNSRSAPTARKETLIRPALAGPAPCGNLYMEPRGPDSDILRQKNPHVLFMSNEIGSLSIMKKTLQSVGLRQVHLAASPEAALTLFNIHPAIEVVIIDQGDQLLAERMEFAQTLRQLAGARRLYILMLALVLDGRLLGRLQDHPADDVNHWLSKPFSVAQLSRVLREAFDDPADLPPFSSDMLPAPAPSTGTIGGKTQPSASCHGTGARSLDGLVQSPAPTLVTLGTVGRPDDVALLRQKSPHVLFMSNEIGSLSIMKKTLQSVGLRQVHLAASPEAALTLFNIHPAIEVVIIDQGDQLLAERMEFAQTLRQLAGARRLYILMLALMLDGRLLGRLRDHPADDVNHWLSKPFSVAQLSRVLREAFDDPADLPPFSSEMLPAPAPSTGTIGAKTQPSASCHGTGTRSPDRQGRSYDVLPSGVQVGITPHSKSLPAVRQHVQSPAPTLVTLGTVGRPDDVALLRQKSPHVLFMSNEIGSLSIMKKTLQSVGLRQVHLAASPEAALTLFNIHPAIEVVIIDQGDQLLAERMEFAQTLRQLAGARRLYILMLALMLDGRLLGRLRDHPADDVNHWLSKPFSVAQLSRVLREAFDDPADLPPFSSEMLPAP